MSAIGAPTVFRVVYAGIGLAGKTSNLQHLHARTEPAFRTPLVGRADDVERTLGFRLTSKSIAGAVFDLVTVPGAVYRHPSHSAVLAAVDGLVLVVDSQRERLEANLEHVEQLAVDLALHDRRLATVPCVVQYNKRDLPSAMPIDELERVLDPRGAPHVAAVAATGDGVFATLRALADALVEARRR